MSGYTPAFSTIFTGTLFGKWPSAAVWASLLPLIDSRGQIEMSYEAIAGMTGWPIELLRQGIQELMQPDPHSRSDAEEGRRLVPLNGERGWGWRAVNVQKYRDKASGRDQVEDGRNAEKVRKYKERHRQTPEDTGGPPKTPTHTQTQTHTQTEEVRGSAAQARRTRDVPEPFEVTGDMRAWAQRECSSVNVDAETAKFRDHEFAKPHSDWQKAWRNWMRKAAEFSNGAQSPTRKTRYEQLIG